MPPELTYPFSVLYYYIPEGEAVNNYAITTLLLAVVGTWLLVMYS